MPSSANLKFNLTSIDNATTIASGELTGVNTTDTAVTGFTIIPQEDVELWWPVGMGPQTLYCITIDLVSGSGQTLASVSKRVGFRTIVLNGDPVSEAEMAKGIAPGNNWHFEINGQPFFAKGSNFIPPDEFWPRVTTQRISDLFDTAIAGNTYSMRS